MGSVIDAIIDKIKRNRISTTEVADCMNKTGVLEGLRSLNEGYHRVGKVFWTYAYNESNWDFHEQIQEPPENAVILCETFNWGNRAVFGALATKFLLLYRQASAIVCDGYVRDAPHILKKKWPVWAKGVTPIGCFNRPNPEPLDPEIVAARREFYRDSLAVCDDSGVVIIPRGTLMRLSWRPSTSSKIRRIFGSTALID